MNSKKIIYVVSVSIVFIIIISIVITKNSKKELNDYITRKAEWYIPADEAIKLKMADGYYKEEIE